MLGEMTPEAHAALLDIVPAMDAVFWREGAYEEDKCDAEVPPYPIVSTVTACA
jgi:hypothetical protein